MTVAGGHFNGSIFTWELAKAARPFLHIPSLDSSQLGNTTTDGHMPNVAVTHLGFLGTRHTALVSADDRGMAFSHLATRGLGAVARSVKSTRILGRYPNDSAPPGKPRKPSTVLAFSPLPLGNVESSTDGLGLTAMLTPYLLVIVSTTPIAQTQHKAARPKEVVAHGAMSGCLAWFPSVKLKVKDSTTGELISKAKLVYCWSNVLTVLEIDEVEATAEDKPPALSFRPRSRWKAEEAIVAVQWLSRSVLVVLTITQRLIVLEDRTLRMTDAFDLVQKHIYHRDIFSKQLHTLVEQLDEDDPSMHGVVADAFYMSFKTYKGRMFLLGFNDVSIGSLSNWSDRLLALMESGDYIGAINLATSYHTGDADKLTIGLPEDAGARHAMVENKLVEIMQASLKFTFGSGNSASTRQENIRDLAEACFSACLAIDQVDFLFDEAYEWYEDMDVEGVFLEILEPFILDKTITSIPPTLVKSIISHYVTQGSESQLEDMICHMDTSTFDIDQITTLCKQHNLYDALIYVWNRAIGDYITPLIELLKLLLPVIQNSDYFTAGSAMDDPVHGVSALKIFPYLSYTFTGRRYPMGDFSEDAEASKAKAELYWFLFSGKSITWPAGSGKTFSTQPDSSNEPSFPYLRMILKFDAPSFLSALNEGFEDSFLNDAPERVGHDGGRDLREEQSFGLSVNRQYIVSTLLDVMNPTDFAPEDTIYLDMFIARNLPKFPQYLLLSGSSLHKVLAGLCNYPGEDIADDAQLSAEYLLSTYHPPDLASLIPLFKKAGFHRVLKGIYRADKEYAKLLETYFDDEEDRMEVFECIADCLRPRHGLPKRQVREIEKVIEDHAEDLARLDPVQTAKAIDAYAPSLHEAILEALPQSSHEEYAYLQYLLEPGPEIGRDDNKQVRRDFVERYVRLMCEFDSAHVAEYVSHIQANDLRLDQVLPAMEESGVLDAAVILMAREGQVNDAMDRLVRHLRTLEAAFCGLLGGASVIDEPASTEAAAEDLLEALQKYTNVGIWLCQAQSKQGSKRRPLSAARAKTPKKDDLLPDELLWLDFLDVTVQITKSVSASLHDLTAESASEQLDSEVDHIDSAKLLMTLRTLVQRAFTALLTSTSAPTPTSLGASLSFLRILQAFLARASLSSPNLSDLRGVLASIFSAYAYEESILNLANRLLDKDLFINVQEASERRQRGWRPRGATCEGCGRRVWGPGAGGDVYGQWEEMKTVDEAKARAKRAATATSEAERTSGGADSRGHVSTSRHDGGKGQAKGKEKGKGKSLASTVAVQHDEENESGGGQAPASDDLLGPLIVLACRHMYHQTCLQSMQTEDPQSGASHDGREFRCPVDG